MWIWITVLWTAGCVFSCFKGVNLMADASIASFPRELAGDRDAMKMWREGADMAAGFAVMFNMVVWAGGLLVIGALKVIFGGRRAKPIGAGAGTSPGEVDELGFPTGSVTIRTCAKCGRRADGDRATCINCGADLSRSAIVTRDWTAAHCTKCGRRAGVGDAFCAGCGAPLAPLVSA